MAGGQGTQPDLAVLCREGRRGPRAAWERRPPEPSSGLEAAVTQSQCDSGRRGRAMGWGPGVETGSHRLPPGAGTWGSRARPGTRKGSLAGTRHPRHEHVVTGKLCLYFYLGRIVTVTAS